MPDTPRSLSRPVFEVPANAHGRAVQAAIDAAATRRGTRPVVHMPAGTYDVSETLTIPASDIQLVGDGYGSVLRWTGGGAGPVVRLQGPSHATLREIQIDGADRANGLVVDNVDQPNGRVFMQQVQLRHATQADLIVDGLDMTHVQMEDFGHAYSPNAPAIRITGGPRRAAGEAAPARVSIFSGASSGNRVSYDVSQGARVLVRDLWYESGAGPGFARISGRAEFTADGLRVSSSVGSEPSAFTIDGLDGRVTILSTHLDDGIRVADSGPNSSVLALGLFCQQRQERCFQDDRKHCSRQSFQRARSAQQPAPQPYAARAQRGGAGRRSARC